MKVYHAIGKISAALSKDGISKDRRNEQQHYAFRGIDDCLNALAPLLSANNLVILPEVLEREVVERQTKTGGALFYVTVKVRYAFVNAEDGSRHDVVTYGEAMDSADKATNKAMSAAYKYAVIQTFCIPTEGDNDADATTHDVAAQNAQAFRPSLPAPQPDEPCVPNYGPDAGKPFSQVPTRHLEDYLAGAERSIKDPKKANFLKKNETMRDLLRAEIEKRVAAEQENKPEPQAAGQAEQVGTPQASDRAPAPFTTLQWNGIFAKVETDPDLCELKEMVKSQLGIETLLYGKTTPEMRTAFVTAFKKAAADNNIADRLTAIGL